MVMSRNNKYGYLESITTSQYSKRFHGSSKHTDTKTKTEGIPK